MQRLSFIQLSDIHFVKTSGDPADIDNELRELLLVDLENNAIKLSKKYDGILLCGDLAFSGQNKEYTIALQFLQEITSKLNIDISSIYCVPGNHDVDQKVASSRKIIRELQNKLESQQTLDNIDVEFKAILQDYECKSLLFDPLQNYNDFATQFCCDVTTEKIVWNKYFDLDNGMRLKIHGMNSCLISNCEDHKDERNERLMYIGQNQIPKYEKDVVCMSLCHHPPDCWKFKDDILKRFNQRADIQMYGHMHEQYITSDELNLILFSGATHPTRGEGWNPCYNWITVECILKEGKRLIKVVVYPRILTNNRERFAPDIKLCNGKLFYEYFIDIEKKQHDIYSDDMYISCNDIGLVNDIDKYELPNNNYRKIAFRFCNMSSIKQRKLLTELDLFDEEYIGENYSCYLNNILSKAKEQHIEKLLIDKILGNGR